MTVLSVIIPARNEEGSIGQVAEETHGVLAEQGVSFRLILVDDGSTDQTGAIMDSLRQAHPDRIEVIHHPRSLGLGGAYKSGVSRVDSRYVTWIPADGEVPPRPWFISLCGALADQTEDVVFIPNPIDHHLTRSWSRSLVSRIFQRSLNLFFLNRIQYFNGNAVYPTRWVKEIRVSSSGFFFNAELLLRILNRFRPRRIELPLQVQPRQSGESKALGLRSFVEVVSSLTRLRISLWL
jgi:glycosyltransferase involved in cell wall biosynthesis